METAIAEVTEKNIEKIIKSTKHWHHDIQYIDGKFVEETVKAFQATQDEDLLTKILDNYSIFRGTWAKAFSQHLDGDVEEGMLMHDQIIWRAAFKFKREKSRKPDGKAFNAYVVSALLNQLKNQRNAKMSHKNHPRVMCPVCNEEVYQIDHKHLKHLIDLDRYKKLFPGHPLACFGDTACPKTGRLASEFTPARTNRASGAYTVADFWAEHQSLAPKFPILCPVTGVELRSMSSRYPSTLMRGYTEEDFLKDFPDFPAAFMCPFTGKLMLEMTQEHLDSVVKSDPTMFDGMFVRRAMVTNPYTMKEVPEITLEMLAEAGTTWKDHMEKHSLISLDKYYPGMVVCPFTGRKTHMIKRTDLPNVGRTAWEFYGAACKFPLRKYQVKCSMCGDWVDNVWSHLEQKAHSYATSMTTNEFEAAFGSYATKVVVRTNSYVENDAGDSIHVADLFPEKTAKVDRLEIEDSLLEASHDDLDRKIASAVRHASTIEDIFYAASELKRLRMGFEFKTGMTKAVREAAREMLGVADFDIVKTPAEGSKDVMVMFPSRDTIRRRLSRMIDCSDLSKP